MIRHDSCPVCSSKDISVFLNCTDYFLSREPFDIFKCSECGFSFTHEHPDGSEAGRYYDSQDYISHSDSKKSITDLAYQLVRKFMLKRKRNLISKITGLTSGSILDIGCGTGHFLKSMKDGGWKIKGIEINERARIYAESRFGIEVLIPEKINDLPEGSFDCITLWHVLEHFQDPDKEMQEISRLLTKNGVCIIALPNNNSFDADYFGKFWAAYDVPRHLWHFNPATFSLFAEKNKFRIEGIKALPFDVFYISVLSEKYRGSRLPFLTGMLKAAVFSLRAIFRTSGSSSVIYCLRKS